MILPAFAEAIARAEAGRDKRPPRSWCIRDQHRNFECGPVLIIDLCPIQQWTRTWLGSVEPAGVCLP